MILAIAIAAVALLLIGFLMLTSLEAKKGARVMPGARIALDGVAERAGLSLGSGHLLVSIGHTLSGLLRYAVHESVHAVLAGIRFIERSLTRAARAIRESNAAHALLSRKQKETAPSETVE